MEKKKSFTVLSLCLLFCFSTITSFAQDSLSIIPKPSYIQERSGYFRYPLLAEVYASQEIVDWADLLREHPNLHFEMVHKLKSRKKLPEQGVFLFKADEEDKLPANAYRLEVDSNKIVITVHQQEALIYAIATLTQIAYTQKDSEIVPAVLIEDAPHFNYRGLMLDVSRHFYPLSFLKKYIDLMALYKLNTFHWHLTDGAGWRLEIKKYPELTEKAAWRSHSKWKDWWTKGKRYSEMGQANAAGGFYTQEEARELVAYAAKKGITVIPEIEMPGHSEEVLAQYPHLSCSGIPYKNSEFCIGNEDTFNFLTGVLTEVVEIFPSTYIHIGGDEADKTAWKSCEKCQKVIKDNNLGDENGLQSYAIKRMETFLKDKGRRLMGWDEILEGGLPPEATVMSWRGEQGGIDAANAGHDVVMTPGGFMYFDSYQTNPIGQPEAMGGLLPLNKVYSYNPLPKEITEDKQKHILGIQANVWTEYMPHQEQVEYMVFPRALALAEVGWSAPDKKNWTDFEKRLQKHYLLMQRLHLHYYQPAYNVDISGKYDLKTKFNTVTITSEQYKPEIRYTTDGSEPTDSSTLYVEPFSLVNTTTVKAALFKDSIRYGDIGEFTADIHKGIGKKIIYNNKWNDRYPAKSDTSLLNGQHGGLSYGDGEWQGFLGDFDVTLDFERREELHHIKLRFMQISGPGVYIPGNVKLLASDDGKHFREMQKIENDVPTTDASLRFKTFEFDLQGRLARYIRIVGENRMKGFLFTDEIVVY
ncbi:beta-N-acetylhexosaminidase [Olivibacter domesticus]|uniref:beta-N-acetylhexosaminidase n=1 Tax=Olivibacter domesticus TaxID=407022 RepID=A0A1H7SU94_OLID1|nr:family 20 glycosylhydrolase [Olivibacter domesticus]SEL75097.1 hexosaminidase [Olivibacter domesticus]